MPPRSPVREAPARLATFVRSALAGGAATLADLVVLGVAVGVLHVTPRVANLPALLVGAAVQFLGNRHFAFRAGKGPLGRQALLFALGEAIALVLNAALYDGVARLVPLSAAGAVMARAVTTNVVFLAWSYPVFKRVFRAPAGA